MKEILAIIPYYNGEAYIHNAILSLQNGSQSCDILLVDNNLSDPNTEDLFANYVNLKVISNSKNVGFGAAVNQGFKHGLKQNYSYFLVLNQDVKLLNDSLQQMKELADKLPKDEWIWISPSHLGIDRKTPEHYFMENFKQRSNAGVLKNVGDQTIRQVDFINAACWFINSESLKKLKGFNERFFMYGEDLEFCNRSKYYGFKMYLMEQTFCIHNKEKGDYENNSDKLLALTIGEALAWYLKKDVSRFKKIKHFVHVNLACVKLVLKGRQEKAVLKYRINLAAALRSL